jgi:hypothetical protein
MSDSLSVLLRAWLLKPALDYLQHLRKDIAMNQEELAQALADIGTNVDKIGVETKGLIEAVAALQSALDAGGDVTPQVAAALADVQARVSAVDALVPDVPAP